MRKDKKLRVIAIIALTISVLGLTLGFAAFSNKTCVAKEGTTDSLVQEACKTKL